MTKHSTGHQEKITKLESGEKILRQAILSGRLRPGMKLVQKDLAEEIGMSPTPVREIMRRLEAEGLVEYIPRKGVYVSGVSAVQYQERIPIRAALEKLAVEMAVPRLMESDIQKLKTTETAFEKAWQEKALAEVQAANLQFHMTLYELSGSPVLCSLIYRMWPRFPTDLLWIVPGRTEQAIQDHRKIIQHVAQKEVEAASLQMWNHIINSGQVILEYIDFQEERVSLEGIHLD